MVRPRIDRVLPLPDDEVLAVRRLDPLAAFDLLIGLEDRALVDDLMSARRRIERHGRLELVRRRARCVRDDARLRGPRVDPGADEVELDRRHGPAHVRHAVALAGLQHAGELPDEEALRRIAGRDAERARRAERGGADEGLVRGADPEIQAALLRRAVARLDAAALRAEDLALDLVERV